MDIGVQIFFSKIEVLHNKGLPGLLVLNDKIITLSDYNQKISAMAKDSSKFAWIQGRIIGKSFLETLHLDLSIQHEIKHIFVTVGYYFMLIFTSQITHFPSKSSIFLHFIPYFP
jgi:hypothetical protein